MKINLNKLLVIIICVSLMACEVRISDPSKLKVGQSTGFDVRDVYGKPTNEWKEPDGSTLWMFVKGPMGYQTFKATIGADNVLKSIEQVLSDPYFAKVQKGMSMADVERILGKPAEDVTFPLKKERVWTWRYQASPSLNRMFDVHFDTNGQVVETYRRDDLSTG
ncbi:MAG: hypothetical protein WCD07_02550 [Burkholderiales bacterium]